MNVMIKTIKMVCLFNFLNHQKPELGAIILYKLPSIHEFENREFK